MIFVAGYGVQAGPTNGQQMKGNGMKHVFTLRTNVYSLTHTYADQQHFNVNCLYVAGYGAQAGGYGRQGTKGNGIINVMIH